MHWGKLAVLAVLALILPNAYATEATTEFGVAVIVGNKAYQDNRVPEVAYAHNDADAFYRFVVGTLGFSPDNVVDLRDATKARMEPEHRPAVPGEDGTGRGFVPSAGERSGLRDEDGDGGTRALGVAHRMALSKAGRQAGDRFRDCLECPQMAAVPAGSYRMGSPFWEQGRDDNENPMHEVTFAAPFALGVYEVTVAEFGRFVDETGYRTDAEREAKKGCLSMETPTWGKWKYTAGRSWRDLEYEIEGGQPVVCVSWNDAKKYAAWLSENTGMPYRLPSESEWEYAARAGSETKYHFGNDEAQLCAYGNVADETPLPNGNTWTKKAACSDGAVYPTRAGTYRPNAFGLYDMHGNVWEWTEDCWNGSYAGAPADGSAWEDGNCTVRVVRSGSWVSGPSDLHAASRSWSNSDNRSTSGNRSPNIGFRVARTLAP